MSWLTRKAWRQPVYFVRLPVTVVINPSQPVNDWAKYESPSLGRRTAKVIRMPSLLRKQAQ